MASSCSHNKKGKQKKNLCGLQSNCEWTSLRIWMHNPFQVCEGVWFSKLVLRNALHQIQLIPKQRKFTAFEANGQLYEERCTVFSKSNWCSFDKTQLQSDIRIYGWHYGVLLYLWVVRCWFSSNFESNKGLQTHSKWRQVCICYTIDQPTWV